MYWLSSYGGSTQLDSCTLLILNLPANINSSIQFWDEAIPGASLNDHDPSELCTVQLKCWLNTKEAVTSDRKIEPVKQYATGEACD